MASGPALRPVYAVRSQHERILEAMLRVVAERGYEEATVTEVVALAGVTRAEFERHFADKEGCFLVAYDAVFDVLVAHVSTAFQSAAGAPWADRVIAALRALVELMAAEADLARMAIIEVTAIGGDARVRYREALDRFIPFLEQGRTASAQAERLPEQTARFAIGAVTTIVFDEIRAGRCEELEAVLPDLVFAVTMPYLGVEAAEVQMRRIQN
ncbi:MAG TPA: helix-turn-helix domain-containing protein [Solirubrobacterales bacterium]|nr:helix-turn-helix domain-containing protein [Solirubrobacterales bacterium]